MRKILLGGFSLFEVVVVMSLLGIVLGSLFQSVISFSKNTLHSQSFAETVDTGMSASHILEKKLDQ